MLSAATILPFMTVLSSPDTALSNDFLNKLYTFMNFSSINQFLFFLGLVVLLTLVLSNSLKAVTRWFIVHFSHNQGYELSKDLFEHYINQPYSYFLTRNSNDLSKNILSETQALVGNILIPILDIISRSVITLLVVGLLIYINPMLALIALATLSIAFIVIFLVFQNFLLRIGEERIKAQTERYKVINEGFIGIKHVKITGKESFFVDLFSKPAQKYAQTQAYGGCIGELPRYALEIVAFGIILLVALFLLKDENSNINEFLPIISLYAFAGYRLMPNLQSIYRHMARIKFNLPVLYTLLQDKNGDTSQININTEIIEPLPFEKDILLEKIGFQYDSAHEPAFNDISLHIEKNTTIGIVGKTGSGKTTLIDILCGLLSPSSGRVIVDGEEINSDNTRSWQAHISYVSQHIFLADDTILKNIAFGLKEDEIDEQRVIEAAKMAQIDDHINSLPESYNSFIGENGIRLSGGQRQRIALARSIYMEKSILIIDEGTSALDDETETKVLETIKSLALQKTIIIISHRPNTLGFCDKIIEIKDGTATEKTNK